MTTLVPRHPWTLAISDTAVMTRRYLYHYLRKPSLLGIALVQPVLFVLLWTYVFSGAIQTPGGITYVHLLFDRHEIVMSEGAWSESLFTGPQALESVSTAARQEIFTLFPDLAAGQIPQPARRLLTGREARQLAERQRRNLGRRQLVEPLSNRRPLPWQGCA